MPIIPAGTFALAAQKLQRMVASSPTWQAAIAAANLDIAQANVFLKNVIGQAPRPFAIVSPGQQHGYKLIAGGFQNVLRPSGSLFLYLAQDTSPAGQQDIVQAEFEAANFFGQVIDDLAALAGADDPSSPDGSSHLALVSIDLETFSAVPEEQWPTLGQWYYAGYSVGWGDG